MKLKINGFENEIIFNEENINILQIEDTKCFTHIIQCLNDKINGIETDEIFLLDDNEQEIKLKKEVLLILDVFNIEYNSKKILDKIYEKISDNIKISEKYEIEEMTFKLRNLIIEEINELPFEFIMKSELEISDLLKLYGLKIDSSMYTDVLEKIEILIDLISTLKIANILIIPNLKLFLKEEELVELYKYSLYNNIKLLLIERKSINKKLNYEKIMYIDENFDEIIL